MRDGLVAEFDSPDALLRAWDRLHREGCRRVDTWSPYPVKGIVRRLPESIIAWIMLGAGLFGGGFGYLLQWWCNQDFKIDVGGRPLDSAPAFIPITFESAVLAASLAGFFTMLGFCGLPRLYHPLFEIDGFERASVDRFWIGVDAMDPRFDERLADVLSAEGALRCVRVGGTP